MTFLIIVALIALLMAAGTLRLVSHDGRGPAAPPSSHFDDPRFHAPSAG